MSYKECTRNENAGSNLTPWWAGLMQGLGRCVRRMWQSPFFSPYFLQHPQAILQSQSLLNFRPVAPQQGHQQGYSTLGQLFQHPVPADSGGWRGNRNVLGAMNSANIRFGHGDGNQIAALYHQLYSASGIRQPLQAASSDLQSEQSTATAGTRDDTNDSRDSNSSNAALKRQMENNTMTASENQRKRQAGSVGPVKRVCVSDDRQSKEPTAASDHSGILSDTAVSYKTQHKVELSTNNSVQGLSEGTKKDPKGTKSAKDSCPQEQPGTSTDADGQSQYFLNGQGHNSPLRQRSWQYTEFGHEVRKQGAKRGYLPFTCASYNVLAQNLLEDHPDLYWQTDPTFLSWEYRSANLLKEIKDSKPDILCLQEVNESHFSDFFLPNLKTLGYRGVFKKRTRNMKDGCVICFRTELFELDDVNAVEYYHPGISVLDRDNIGLILRLRTVKKKHREHKFCVATTHLLFNPRRGDVKLAQLMNLLAEIDEMAYKGRGKPWKPNYYPVILCGDLNSEPHCDLYKFLCRGSLDYEGLLCRGMSGQREDRSGRNNFLSKTFLSPRLGISDQCQYISHLKERLDKYDAYKVAKGENTLSGLKEEEENSVEASGHKAQCDTDAGSPNTDEVSEINSSSLDVACATGEQSPPNSPTTSTPETAGKDAGVESGDVRYHYSQNSGQVSHKLNLRSVYSHGRRGEPEVTTHHMKANCTVDYIFYSVQKKHTRTRHDHLSVKDVTEGKLHLLATKELPTGKKMNKLGPIPNQAISSDHLMLMAKFLLKIK